jgi:hypothetical protein
MPRFGVDGGTSALFTIKGCGGGLFLFYYGELGI